MVSKFTQKDLEKMEGAAELKAYQWFQRNYLHPRLYTSLPDLTEKQEKDLLFGITTCSPLLWEIFNSWKEHGYGAENFPVILGNSEINEYEQVCQELEAHFPGKDTNTGKDAMIYKSFKTYTELAVESMRLFLSQFDRLGGFGGGSYEQLFSSVRLGLYSAPENCVLSRAGLNYPDLRNDPSPRLNTVKKFLEKVYFLRVRFQVLDAFIRLDFFKKDVPGYQSQNQWDNFLKDVKERLQQKFKGNADKAFQRIFGSDNPSLPKDQTEFNYIQEQILNWILKVGVHRGPMGDEPIDLNEIPHGMDGFHRDYAKEQAERKKREEAERQRQEREQEPDWGNIHERFTRSDGELHKFWWTKLGFTYNEVKEWIDIGLDYDQSGFAYFLKEKKGLTAEQALNIGDVSSLRNEYEKWGSENLEAKALEKKIQKEWKEFQKEKNKNNNIDENDIPKPTEPTQDEKKNSHPPSRSRSRSASPSRQAAKDKLDGKEVPPPKHTEFDSTEFNDGLNGMLGDFNKETQENNLPYTPAPGLGMPINSITKEEAEKMPWLGMGFNLEPDSYWRVFSPHNIPFGGGGSGDLVELLLQMYRVEEKDYDFKKTYHQFFWNQGDENIKGFARLKKNDDPARESEKDSLLINGKRNDDIRSSKLGWKWWPFGRAYREGDCIQIGVPGVEQKSYRFTRMFRNQRHAYDLDNVSHLIGLMREKGIISKEPWSGRKLRWGSAPKTSIFWITNQLNFEKHRDWQDDDPRTINPNNGFSHYLLFSSLSTSEINQKFINNKTPANNAQTLAELISKLNQGKNKTALICIGPDVLHLKDLNSPEKKAQVNDVKPSEVENAQKKITPQDLKDMNITPEEFDTLNAPFQDPAKIANIIKKIANSNKPEKVKEMLDKLFEDLPPSAREAMFNQMVDHNPVFSEEEKTKLKEAYQKAKTKEEKKKVWEHLTSHQAAREAHKNKTPEEKDKVFEEQVNKNPAYGPPGEDTQERRTKFEEYEKAPPDKKEQMQEQENQKFTTGENAAQWGEFWQAAANKFAGADDNLNCEGDDYNQQFSWADSFQSVHKLKDIFKMMPEHMNEGMKSNKPYWQVIWSNPLVYIFLFIGFIMAVLTMSIKKK